MYESFQAQGMDRFSDFKVDVFSVKSNKTQTPDMCIATKEGPIFITKEQAMKFFGLVDAVIFENL